MTFFIPLHAGSHSPASSAWCMFYLSLLLSRIRLWQSSKTCTLVCSCCWSHCAYTLVCGIFFMFLSINVPPSLFIAHPVCDWFYVSCHLAHAHLSHFGQPAHASVLWMFSYSDSNYASHLLHGVIFMSLYHSMGLHSYLSCSNLQAHFHLSHFWLYSNFKCFVYSQIPLSGCFPVLINSAFLLLWVNLSFFLYAFSMCMTPFPLHLCFQLFSQPVIFRFLKICFSLLLLMVKLFLSIFKRLSTLVFTYS